MSAGVDRPVGVRLTPGAPLVWVDAGGLAVEVGEWVVLAGEGGEQVGEVVVRPSQVIESVLVGALPFIVRRAGVEELPPTGTGHGAALLRSLELPAWAAEPPAASGGGPPPDEQRSREQDQRQHAGED